ncbi:RAP domain-containing protein [Besnoitia besnoiti]|uniref:RAP domain-containing protein n=1 Tax=Besnoitia besnoiti TaxID=94643 RepID=A0A2A9MEA3_BESBE|nr:RAP domain-containing protein [Besnoitia besnoiti]PFH33957.1 RAP domain-containing protein [Besnoitia besnoiti]
MPAINPARAPPLRSRYRRASNPHEQVRPSCLASVASSLCNSSSCASAPSRHFTSASACCSPRAPCRFSLSFNSVHTFSSSSAVLPARPTWQRLEGFHRVLPAPFFVSRLWARQLAGGASLSSNGNDNLQPFPGARLHSCSLSWGVASVSSCSPPSSTSQRVAPCAPSGRLLASPAFAHAFVRALTSSQSSRWASSASSSGLFSLHFSRRRQLPEHSSLPSSSHASVCRPLHPPSSLCLQPGPLQLRARAAGLLDAFRRAVSQDSVNDEEVARRPHSSPQASEPGGQAPADLRATPLGDEELQFLLHNISIFSPSELLILFACIVRWHEKAALPSSSVAFASLPSTPPPLFEVLSPAAAALLSELVSRLGTQLPLLPEFPSSALLCGRLVLSSPGGGAPRFWEQYFQFFLSAAQLRSSEAPGIHNSSLRVSAAPELLQLLSFLAQYKAQGRAQRAAGAQRSGAAGWSPSLAGHGDKTESEWSSQHLSRSAPATGDADGDSHAPAAQRDSEELAEYSNARRRGSAPGDAAASRSATEEASSPLRNDAGAAEARQATPQGAERAHAVSSLSPSFSPSSSFGRRGRLTTLQDDSLYERLVAALCSRLAARPTLETLSPPSLIRLLLLLAELRAKHVPLLTEIAALLKPLGPPEPPVPAAAPVGPKETARKKASVAVSLPLASSSSRRQTATQLRSDLMAGDDAAEGEPQFVARVAASGLNRAFQPQDLVVIFASFAALEANEFQPLLRSVSDVLALHARQLSLQLMASTLDSCSRLNFYPKRLAKALLEVLPGALVSASAEPARPEFMPQDSEQWECRKTQGRRAMQARRVPDKRRDRTGRAQAEGLRVEFASPPSASLPASFLCLQSTAAVWPSSVCILMKALARLNVRHRGTLKAALLSLNAPQGRGVLPSPCRLSSPDSRDSCASPRCADDAGGPDSLTKAPAHAAGLRAALKCAAAPHVVSPHRLTPQDTASVLYALYRLDVWDSNTVRESLAHLEQLGGSELLAALGLKGCANLLLVASYFSCAGPKLYDEILPYMLPMESRLTKEGISQLKIIELACRVGHLPFSFSGLSAASRDLLLRIRSCGMEPEEVFVSDLQREVSSTARTVGYHCFTEVQVGPYTLDFVKPVTPEDAMKLAMEEEARKSNPGFRRPLQFIDDPFEHELDTKGVVLEVDGPQHFYRDSFHWTSASKLKHRLLTGLGFRVAHVPYFDWLKLESEDVRRVYLRCALERAEAPAGDDLERWASRVAASSDVNKRALGSKESQSTPAAHERGEANTPAARTNSVAPCAQEDDSAGDDGRRIAESLAFAPAPFLTPQEQRLLHEKKHQDSTKRKKIMLAISKRDRRRQKREDMEARRRKEAAIQNNPRNYKL